MTNILYAVLVLAVIAPWVMCFYLTQVLREERAASAHQLARVLQRIGVMTTEAPREEIPVPNDGLSRYIDPETGILMVETGEVERELGEEDESLASQVS